MERLPCGCRMETQVIDGQPMFIYEPCALDCRYYLYVLEEGKRQGKPTTVVDAS
jgi:hypothetical protein